jgi:hypothetical protein
MKYPGMSWRSSARHSRSMNPFGMTVLGLIPHVPKDAKGTLFPKADSWYAGPSFPGKPRVFTSRVGGYGPYRARCDEATATGYGGFALGGHEICAFN